MPVKIHGKDYKTVAERVKEIHEKHSGDISILTEIISINEEKVLIKAKIEIGEQLFTGHAMEVFGSTMINKTSALENAETSAIGRALASAGYGGTEFASADEVANAIAQQSTTEEDDDGVFEYTDKMRDRKVGFGKYKDLSWKDVPNGYLKWIVDNSDNEKWRTIASAEIISRAGDNVQQKNGSDDTKEEKAKPTKEDADRRDTINTMMTALINSVGMDEYKKFATPRIGDRKPAEVELEQYEKLYKEFSTHVDNLYEKTSEAKVDAEPPVEDSSSSAFEKTLNEDLPF